MRKIILLITVCALSFSCGGSGSGPEATADKFMEAFIALDYEKAEQFADKDELESLKFMQEMMSNLSPSLIAATKALKVDYKVVDRQIGDGNSTVRYRVTMSGQGMDDVYFSELTLEKIGDKWKVTKRNDTDSQQ